MALKRIIRRALIYAGARSNTRPYIAFNLIHRYVTVARWLDEHGLRPLHHLENRDQVFDLVGELVGKEPTLYIELGVADGASMRYWCSILQHEDSRLHGFDTFWGLPDDWNREAPRGKYSQHGRVPEITDNRVEFFVGLFEETLPGYKPPEHQRLVINFDADLYSSTMVGLNTLRDQIVPGTLLYFDEFCDVAHELRAFDEFMRSTGVRFRMIAEAEEYQRTLFERVE